MNAAAETMSIPMLATPPQRNRFDVGLEVWRDDRAALIYWLGWCALIGFALMSARATQHSDWWISPTIWWMAPILLWLLPPPTTKSSLSGILAIAAIALASVKPSSTLTVFVYDALSSDGVDRKLDLAFAVAHGFSAIALALLIGPLLRLQFGAGSVHVALLIGLYIGVRSTPWNSILSPAQWERGALSASSDLLPLLVYPLLWSWVAKRLRSAAPCNTGDVKNTAAHELPARVRGFPSYVVLSLFIVIGGEAFALWDPFGSSKVSIGIQTACYLIGMRLVAAKAVDAWRRVPANRTRGPWQEFIWMSSARSAIVVGVLAVWVPSIATAVPFLGRIMDTEIRAKGNVSKVVILWSGSDRIGVLGEIREEMAVEFERLLEAHPELQVVALNSSGGEIRAAARMAEAIHARGMTTRVVGECASACTVLLVSGRERLMIDDAQVGFHRASSVGLPNDAWDRELIASYETYGVRAAFVSEAMRIPHWDMWYPKRSELLDAGVLTGIVLPGGPSKGPGSRRVYGETVVVVEAVMESTESRALIASN